MTREEASNILDDYDVNFEGHTAEEIAEAFEVAFRALEQEPCEDAIGRSDMLDAIGHGTTYTSEELQRIIKALPSVNAQYTEDEIQKMQNLEQAEIEKAYELGKSEGQESEDAISRQAVNNLQKYRYNCGDTSITCISLKSVNDLPPVNPQPKTGHWISFGVQGEVDGQIVQVFTCSECGAISIFRMVSGNILNGDICANCGAKMIEPQESEEE